MTHPPPYSLLPSRSPSSWFSSPPERSRRRMCIGSVGRSSGHPPAGPDPESGKGFRQGLRALSYDEVQNLVIEYRYAEGNLERLHALAAELVRLKVDVIVAVASAATRAVQHATRTILIVMAGGSDPVRAGLVASLARPGGNITGFSNLTWWSFPRSGWRFLKEMVPQSGRVAVLANPLSREAQCPHDRRPVSQIKLVLAEWH